MRQAFEIVVQKFGGSLLASPQNIFSVANFIKKNIREDRRICVVVSAMGHTTNQLLELAHQIAHEPKKRELDMLISCGERSSMALLAMALHEIGVSAKSLTGSQSGIITDNTHGGARIKTVIPYRVHETLLTHQAVIVAGFQGVSEEKEVTTLRRGGSDATAVALAAALGASSCEIYSDVEGVMNIDPRVSRCAQRIEQIDYDHMDALALYGAKVLAHDAVLLAKEFGVNVNLSSMAAAPNGTKIGHVDKRADEKSPLRAITHLRGIVRLVIDDASLSVLLNEQGYFLLGKKQGAHFVGYVSNDISQERVDTHSKQCDSGLALITLHVTGNPHVLSVYARALAALDEESITVSDGLVGRNEVFIIISDSDLNRALRCVSSIFFANGSAP